VKTHQTTNGSFQDSILEHLHHHTITNMFFDKKFEAHHAQILSSLGLGWVLGL
jgi:hypothetical protein